MKIIINNDFGMNRSIDSDVNVHVDGRRFLSQTLKREKGGGLGFGNNLQGMDTALPTGTFGALHHACNVHV
jgi:hypothetical protein